MRKGLPRYVVNRYCACGNVLSIHRRIDLCRVCAVKARQAAETRYCQCGAVLGKGQQLCDTCRPPVVRYCRCGAELSTRRRYCDACVLEIQELGNRKPAAKSAEWAESDFFDGVRALGGPGGLRSSLADEFELALAGPRLRRIPRAD